MDEVGGTAVIEAAAPEAQQPASPDRWRRARPWLVPLGIVALAVALPLVALWRFAGPPMEEGFMLTFPELVLHGAVPNRDFLHLYGPGSLWVLAGVYKVFGTTLEVERGFGLVQQLGVALGVVALAAPWGRWVAAAAGALTIVVLAPPIGLTAMAWTGGLALGLWSLKAALAATRRAGIDRAGTRRRWLTAAGVLAGTALLYRPDLVLALGLASVVVWRSLDRPDRRRLLGALALGLSPYVVHVAIAGPGNVFRGLVLEPVFDLRPGRHLPVPPSWDHFDSFLQRAAHLIQPAWPLPALPTAAQLSLWFWLLLAANVLLLAVGVHQSRRGDRRLLAIALFCIGLIPQGVQRPDSTHLAWASCVPLGMTPVAVAALLRGWRPSWGPVRTAAAAVAVPVVITLTLVPHYVWRTYEDLVAQSFGYSERDRGTMRNGDRIFYSGRLDAVDAVNRLIADAADLAEPGDNLVVGTGDLRKTPYSEAFLYYLLPNLEPGTRYIELDPGIANAPDSGLADELRDADIVILSTIRDSWDEPNDSRKFGSNEPNEVIDERFCLVHSYGEGPNGRGLYELYERCRAVNR